MLLAQFQTVAQQVVISRAAQTQQQVGDAVWRYVANLYSLRLVQMHRHLVSEEDERHFAYLFLILAQRHKLYRLHGFGLLYLHGWRYGFGNRGFLLLSLVQQGVQSLIHLRLYVRFGRLDDGRF